MNARSRRRRLERAAFVVMAIGVAVAWLTYWLETRNAGPSIEELLPGSTAAHMREMGMMYGQTYAIFLSYIEDLEQPGGHALLIVIASAIVAVVCLRLAVLAEEDHDATPHASA